MRNHVIIEVYVCVQRLFKKNKFYGPFLYTRLTCLLVSPDFVLDFELCWSTCHLLSVSLMLEYHIIFFPIFFAMNEKIMLDKAMLETESFIYRLKNVSLNILDFKVCASFSCKKNWKWLHWINLEKFDFKAHF